MIYLDNNATTPVDPQVLEAMLPWFCEQFGNAASISHEFGLSASDAVESARELIAQSLGANLREIVFTSGATEANNLAIKGAMRAAGRGSHLIVNVAEHKAVLDPASRLRREGFEVTVLPVDDVGCVNPSDVAAAIRPDTAIVSVMLANNEIGSINPIAEIGGICRDSDVYFHCDAVQAIGKLPVNVVDLNVDLLSLSAHKAYGPKGIGALFVRETEPAIGIEPLVHGGGHESGLRSGTLPVPLIVGFAEAIRIAMEGLDDEPQRLSEFAAQLLEQLQSRVPGVVVNGPLENRLPGNLSISIPEIDGDVLMSNIEDIAVSSGSACTTAEPEPSHVLRAIGRSSKLALASVRFGFGRFNTTNDVEIATEAIVSAAQPSDS